MPLDQELKKRLVLAKRLLIHGINHANEGTPLSRMIAIHDFDNAIELLLKRIGTKYNVEHKRIYEQRFKDIWNEINIALAQDDLNLPLKHEIFETHDLRNHAQHYGLPPSQDKVEKSKVFSEEFFRRVLEEIFDISYEELYSSILIENEEIRATVLNAEQALENEEYEKCIDLCDDAFGETFNHFDIWRKAGFLTGYFAMGDELKDLIEEKYIENEYKNTDYFEFAKEVSRALLQLGKASTTMQFLDEYRSSFLKYADIESLSGLSEEELKEFAIFAIEFIVNLNIKWQETLI